MLREILLLHHTHTDIGYTHDQPTVWELNRQFIDDALELVEATAGWDEPSRPVWTCEVTETLRAWLRDAAPADVERFRRAVAAGRVSACAMPYNLTPMAGVAQFVRGLAPLAELRRALGLPLTVALNHDVNGLPWTMVPLLLDAGVELVIMGINVHFGGFPLHRPLFFRWVGPDGRAILALNGEHYGMFQRYARVSEGSLDAMAEGIAAYERKLAAQGYPHDVAYLSLTHMAFWDNNPPYPHAAEMVRRWNAENRTPRLRFVTPEDLLAWARTLELPSYAGDWTDYWNFGAGSSAHETRLGYAARAALAAADLLALRPDSPRDRALPRVAAEAYAALTLWDEHTWGNYASISGPDRDAVVAGWYHKAAPAYRASSLARYVLAEQLEGLAGNPRHAPRAAGALLVNPTPFARSEMVAVPRELLDGSYTHLSSTAHRFADGGALETMLDVSAGAPQPAWVGPVDLPPYGYARLPLAELTARPLDGLGAGEGWIESPAHHIRFDPATGAIGSLLDRRTGRELFDARAGWPMLGLVHETADAPADTPSRGREPLLSLDYGEFQETSFVAGWPALRAPEQVRSARTLREPHRVGLEVRSALPGAPEVLRRVWLHADRDVIAVEVALRKDDVRAPDAVYLALPLDLPGWEAVYDTMGTPTQLDAEQLAGSCRDWVTVSGFVDVHAAGAGVTLACPDAPLVMVGGFTFGERRLAVERGGPPLLLAWLLNNYWNTNFRASQPGWLRFRYELTTHAGYSPERAARAAACAWSVIVHPQVDVGRAERGALLEVEGEGVVLAAAERREGAALLWLQNLAGVPRRARLRLGGRAITGAVTVDTLGAPLAALPVAAGAAEVDVPARGLVGVRLT